MRVLQPDYESEVVSVGSADNPFLLGAPQMRGSVDADQFLISAALSDAGAAEMLSSGRQDTESRLYAECFAPHISVGEKSVDWQYFLDPRPALDSTRTKLLDSLKCNDIAPRLPELMWCLLEDDHAEFMLHVPQNLAWFDGHFPGQPILPGVIQLDWAIRYSALIGIIATDFRAIPRVKFSALVVPNQVLRLKVANRQGRLQFSFESAAGVHSQGAVEFG